MADNMQATPQNPYWGSVSNGLFGVDNFLSGNSIGREISDSFGIPGFAQLTENMSYGQPPYTGTGFAARPNPLVYDSLFNLGINLNPAIGQAVQSGFKAAPAAYQTLDDVIRGLISKQK